MSRTNATNGTGRTGGVVVGEGVRVGDVVEYVGPEHGFGVVIGGPVRLTVTAVRPGQVEGVKAGGGKVWVNARLCRVVQGEGVRHGGGWAWRTAWEVLERLGMGGGRMPVAATDVGGRVRLVAELVKEARAFLHVRDVAGADHLLSEAQRVIDGE